MRPTWPAGSSLVSCRPMTRSGLPKRSIEVVGEHGLGAVDGLLRRLADEHECAVPLVLRRGHGARSADEHGGVDVMTAGVHDADLLAGLVVHEHVRGVGDAGLLDDGERVHVGADEERGAGAVLEDGDDTVGLRAVRIFADVLCDGVPGLAKLGGEEGGGVLFEVRQLGVCVEVFVEVEKVRGERWRLRAHDGREKRRAEQQRKAGESQDETSGDGL